MNRPYQTKCLEAIRQGYLAGVTRQLIVQATGTGKAVQAANVPSYIPLGVIGKRMLFLVHRNELVYQAYAKFKKYNPSLAVGIEKAKVHSAPTDDVVIASIQTLCNPKRMEQFKRDDFWIVMVDETHHAANSKTWQSILRYFRVLKGDPDEDRSILLIGWTATPGRSDSVGLECLYDKVIFNYGIREAITDGWLVQPCGYRVETEVDISSVHTSGGDFVIKELQDAVNTPARNELIARKYEEICPGEPSLFFTVDIQHSHDLAEALRRHNFSVFPISGKTPDSERNKLIDLMRQGQIHGLCSAGIFEEGTDIPIAQAAFLCRPYKSGLRYRQNVGRVLRPYPSAEELAALSNIGLRPERLKTSAIIVDVCDMAGRHNLVTSPTLFGLAPDFNAKGKALLQQVEEIEAIERKFPGYDFRAMQTLEAVKTSVRSIDLLAPPAVPPEISKHSKLSWLKESEGAYRLPYSDGMVSMRQDNLGVFHVYRHNKGVKSWIGMSDTIEEALVVAEEMLPEEDRRLLKTSGSWRRAEPTDAQCKYHWNLSRSIRSRFRKWEDYYQFALQQYHLGDESHTKGNISRKIDQCRAGRIS